MKIGQKMLVAEICKIRERDPMSNEYFEFYGEESKCNLRIIKAINFSTTPFKLNQLNGCEELYFNGISLIKIQYPYGKINYGVGLFWTIEAGLLWNQFGYICLLSDIEGKRYLRYLNKIQYTNK